MEMKSNTDDLKAHLRRALVSAPDDNSLREAKTHILRAIEAIEDVESRRDRRQSAIVERRQKNLYIPDVKSAYKAIESELASEKAKLEQIVKRKSSRVLDRPEPPEEMQNVFG